MTDIRRGASGSDDRDLRDEKVDHLEATVESGEMQGRLAIVLEPRIAVGTMDDEKLHHISLACQRGDMERCMAGRVAGSLRHHIVHPGAEQRRA